MSIDFHGLMEPIDINRLIFIDYIDYIDWFPMIDFHRLDTSGNSAVSEIYVEITAKLFSFFRELTLRDFKNSFAIR